VALGQEITAQTVGDLAGIAGRSSSWPRRQPAACDSIRESIRRLGFSEARTNEQVRAMQNEQARQGADIEGILKFLRRILLQDTTLRISKKLDSDEPFPIDPSNGKACFPALPSQGRWEITS
jgi:hypothetical protein